MSQLHAEAEATAQATPEIVWALVGDANRYPEWGPWSAGGYEPPDDAARVGAIQWFRYGRRTTSVERVLDVEPCRRVAYTVIRGIPVRNYRAEITLTPTDTGTHIRWAATWDRTLPGRVVQRTLRRLYPKIVATLVDAANARARSSS